MKIMVTGKGIDIGDAFRSYITDHLSEMVAKYFTEPFDITITITKEGHIISSDIAAHVGRGIKLRSHEDNMDPYTSFDLALHKMDKRLRRYKNRLKEHHTKHDFQSEMKALNYILAHDFGTRESQEDDPSLPTEKQSAVIAEITEDIPTLSVSDAVMHMDLSDLPVLVFRNSAHGALNVVHRRHDGNIGWIDPEGVKGVRKIG